MGFEECLHKSTKFSLRLPEYEELVGDTYRLGKRNLNGGCLTERNYLVLLKLEEFVRVTSPHKWMKQ